ncbi:uncharacterized protein LOC109850688 isoform X2 [Asparagus officinalis]|uniref:uncharacterized protein LOC109850688 isoform X2 n=1 Tax=Asparagus officinalis TaxID=4686 RepID=UPI00098E8380|nr:uncharacterized protein LOC109850688 isoform X2 [Asparagus officinalis]
MMSILMSFFFPPPPSLFITAMTIVSFTSLAYTGLSEIRGKHLHYSKFWNVGNSSENKKIENEIKISSRVGMLLFYGPAAAAAAASFFVPGLVVGLRAQLLSWALLVQFFKRVLEVLFIHQYSGQILLSSAVPITSSYLSGTELQAIFTTMSSCQN